MPALAMTWSQSTFISLAAQAHERTVLDLKTTYDLSDPTTVYEMAKDLAAFANTLGGTVLVGVSEKSDANGRKTGRIEAFAPVTNTASLIAAATTAAKDMCRPVIVADPQVIRLTRDEQAAVVAKPVATTIEIVAFNVMALIMGPGGAAACDATGARIKHAYRFPVRVVEGTKLLEPEELAFYMNSHERRVFLQLQNIAADPVLFWEKGIGHLVSGTKYHGRILELDAARMLARIQVFGEPGKALHVPLTFINAVWVDEKDWWNVDIRGALDKRLGFVPDGSVP